MKLFRALCAAAIFPVVLFSSCKPENTKVNPDPAYAGDENLAYMPLQKGKYVEYDVDSTYWDDFLALRTNKRLQMRYDIADTFTDAQGRLSYRVDVSTRRFDTLQWMPESVFYITPTTANIQWVQNNLRFIKLRFPVIVNQTWNGNEFIATDNADLSYLADWPYKVTSVGGDFANPKFTFKNTATVLQVDEQVGNPEQLPTAYAFRNYGKEVYARGIGMVYKELVHWVYDPGVRKARKGYAVVMKAYKYN